MVISYYAIMMVDKYEHTKWYYTLESIHYMPQNHPNHINNEMIVQHKKN